MAPGLQFDESGTSTGHAAQEQEKSTRSSLNPCIAELDCSSYGDDDALVADIVAALKISGGCLVRNMYSQSTLDTMEGEI